MSMPAPRSTRGTAIQRSKASRRHLALLRPVPQVHGGLRMGAAQGHSSRDLGTSGRHDPSTIAPPRVTGTRAAATSTADGNTAHRWRDLPFRVSDAYRHSRKPIRAVVGQGVYSHDAAPE